MLIQGSINMPEGHVFNRWVHGRFKKNKNLLLAMIGPTGSGKTYASIRLCELWYQYHFNKPYPAEHIVFSIDELSEILTSGKLKRGDIVIFEEAGVSLSSLEWQNKLSKLTGYIFQVFRSDNIGVIFTLPSIAFMNKTTRVLLHGCFETAGVDVSKGTSTIKPLLRQYNSRFDKTYTHYPRISINGVAVPIERMTLSKPSDALLKVYEERKNKFVRKVVGDLKEHIESNKPLTVDELLDNEEYLRESVDLTKEGKTQQNIADILSQRYNDTITRLQITRLLKKARKIGVLPRKVRHVHEVPYIVASST